MIRKLQHLLAAAGLAYAIQVIFRSYGLAVALIVCLVLFLALFYWPLVRRLLGRRRAR
jgi:uncharacterized membrane protein YdfJ with MMPL/SSD domain